MICQLMRAVGRNEQMRETRRLESCATSRHKLNANRWTANSPLALQLCLLDACCCKWIENCRTLQKLARPVAESRHKQPLLGKVCNCDASERDNCIKLAALNEKSETLLVANGCSLQLGQA